MTTAAASISQPLADFLAQATGSPAAVEKVWPLPGGASRETWAVDAVVERGPQAGRHALVLRLDMASNISPDALGRADEFRLLQLAYDGGVLCPRPRWLCLDAQVLGLPFFLMDRVEGESIGGRVVRRPELAEARRALPAQMAVQLARIHRLEWQELDFLPRPPLGLSPAQHAINNLRHLLRSLAVESPGLATCLRWLEQRPPPASPLCLAHGDFRVGNLIVDGRGLAAVIDWEFSHVGDPLEDLAWPLVRDWRFGNDGLRLGGIAAAGPFLAAYEQASGHKVDLADVTYWEIMGNVKWAVACLAQARRHLSGQDISVELASLGRRSAEMELEALRLIAAWRA